MLVLLDVDAPHCVIVDLQGEETPEAIELLDRLAFAVARIGASTCRQMPSRLYVSHQGRTDLAARAARWLYRAGAEVAIRPPWRK